jgi:hypothetical protein
VCRLLRTLNPPLFPALRKEIAKELPQSRAAMVASINAAFTKISRDREFINKCTVSMYERIEECVAHNGGLFEPYRRVKKK